MLRAPSLGSQPHRVDLDLNAYALAARFAWRYDEDPSVYEVWVARDGCGPRRLARTVDFNVTLGPVQLTRGRAYFLRGQWAHPARLMAARLAPGCRVAPPRAQLTLPAWQQHLEVAVAGRSLLVTRDDRGVRRRRLP